MSFLSGLPSYSWYIVPAFLTLITIVVFVHELGHFLIARLFGVRVDIFSIGFGRGLLTWKDRHQTQWKIGWIPLGGYVKFFGDADGASTPDREAAAGMSAQDRKVAFLFKPLWQRALVVIGGPLANFLLAIVILSALFMFHGQIVVPPVVGDIVPHGPAAKAGFQIGDRILSVDGTQTGSFVDVAQVVSLSAGQTLPIVLDRAGRQLTVWAVPQEVALTDRLGNRQKVGDLGLSPPAPPIVDSVLPGKPAQRAGLRPGDRIVSIDGRAVTSFEQVQRLISANPGRQVEIVLGRGRGTVTTHATPYRDKDGRRLLGFAFAVPVSLERLPPFAAFEASITE
ncbi:MAG TPA: RIP metalloprotease RseP, partial [Rhizomicrobium sp.]